MRKLFFVFILIYSLPVSSLEVVFINPAAKGNSFWDQVNQIALSAAQDLNIDFKIIQSGGHRLFQKKIIKALIATKSKPDYIVFLPYDGTAFESFTQLEQAKISFVTIERTLFPDLKEKLGRPKEKFKFWLGEIYHDNKIAGRLLAKALIQASNQKSSTVQALNVIGISGDMSGHSSERNAGLIEELEADTDFSLAQVVNARWERKVAAEMYIGLLKRYQDIKIIWTAADIMALGVIDATEGTEGIKEIGKIVNQNLFIGGFDWSQEALIAIQNNNYTASVGGHFMQVAWALVKIYDHNLGKEAFLLADNSPSYQLQLIDINNIDKYQILLTNPDWNKINFRNFSLFHRSELNNYQFDFSNVLLELKQ